MLDETTTEFLARRLTADDCDDFRAMRIRALATCTVFMPLIEDHSDRLPLDIESSWRREVWIGFLQDEVNRQFFGLFTDRKLIGIGQLKRIDAEISELKSAFILPEYRGRGLWKLLVDVRIQHAIRMNYSEARIGHRIGNEIMARAIAKTSFVEIFREQMKNKYQDGDFGHRIVYSMRLPRHPALIR
jgi:GNAT superfamily N-acetyltransferase